MSFDELTQRLTRRLEPDPELRLDVAQELRAHLDDAAADFQAGGMGQDEARAAAIKALGNADELAEQLWQANRRRMGLRRVLRATAEAVLVPAAVLTIVLIVVGMRPQQLRVTDGLGYPSRFDLPSDYPADKRVLLQGDRPGADYLAVVRAVHSRWPEDPVYMAQHAGLSLTKLPREEALALLEAGEKLEPDNALYNFMRAGLWMKQAAELKDDPQLAYVTYGDNTTRPSTGDMVEIKDATLFERVLAEARRGVAKPYCDSHTRLYVQRRLEAMPADRRMSDHLRRMMLAAETLLPPLSEPRQVAKAMGAHAVQIARDRPEEALRLVRDAQLMGARMAARAGTLIELLVGSAIHQHGLVCEELVQRRLGKDELAAQAESRRKADGDLLTALRRPKTALSLEEFGMFGWALTPSFAMAKINPEPLRSAEYAVTDELALLALLSLVTLCLLAGLLVRLVNRLRGRRAPSLSLRWHEVARIAFWAVVVPLGLYAVYAYLTPLGLRRYGMAFTAGKMLVEYGLVIGVVLVLLHGLSSRAFRCRAAELDLSVPRAWRWREHKLLAALVLLVVLGNVAYLGLWYAEHLIKLPRDFQMEFAAIVTGLTLLTALVMVVIANVRGRAPEMAVYRRAAGRSRTAILAAAVVVVGAVGGLSLAARESSAIARAKDNGALLLYNELDLSDYGQLRDHLAKEADKLSAERSAQPGE